MEDRLDFIKDFADYMLKNLKYNSAFSVTEIEKTVILYGLYRASTYDDITEWESACINCLYNKLSSTMMLPDTNKKTESCLLLEAGAIPNCGCFKKE